MKVIRKSGVTGQLHEREIPVTERQLLAWCKGVYAQEAMPNISADDREFLISGTTPEEWEKLFGEPELGGEA